jgi:phosphatidylserine decarboxylase
VVEDGGVRVRGLPRWASKRCQVVEVGGVRVAGIVRWASKRCQVVEVGGVRVAGIVRWAIPTTPLFHGRKRVERVPRSERRSWVQEAVRPGDRR